MKRSKFLSVLLTVCMIVSLVPAVAIPARATRSDPVAKIGDTEYYTIKEAVKAAKDGDTVTLLAGVKLDYNKNEDPEDATLIIKDKDITLDLNDYFVHINYSCVGYRVIKVLGTGKLTLTDNAKSGTIRYIVLGNDGSSHPGRGWTVQTEQPSGEDGTDYLKVEGGFITGGNANGIGGGGVYVGPNATFTMAGGTILGNTTCTDSNGNAVYHGGGVYSLGTFNMTGGTIRNNVAWGNGGGVYAAGEFNMSGGEIKGNTATVHGGGVYAAGTVNITSGTISGNTAPNGFGGGVCVEATGTFSMSSGTIGGTTGEAKNTAAYGGGVFLLGGEANSMTGGKISGNTSNAYGGGVYLMGTLTMNGESAEISGNTAAGYGGGVYVSELAVSRLALKNGAISNNIAVSGGGVYVAKGTDYTGALEMTGGKITANQINTPDSINYPANGGGVYTIGEFTMNGASAEISGNIAAGNGGGVYGSGTFTLKNGTISNNIAGVFGGGVCVDAAGTFKMEGGTIGGTTEAEKNTAAYGGGVLISGDGTNPGGTFNMTGGEISGNTATDHGGGVYVIGAFTMSGTNAKISGNTAPYGGGVTIHGAEVYSLTMTGGTISGNSAVYFGGGVYDGGGVLNVSGSSVIQGNVVGGTKGEDGMYSGDTASNVYLTGGNILTLTGALDNSARIGVAKATPGAFTCDANKFGITAKNVSTFFTSDESTLAVGLNEDNEAELAAAVVVTFNANDGTETPATSTQNLPGGLDSALAKNSFTRTGYSFAGWATTNNGNVVYDDSASVKLTKGITLYAKWDKLPTNVSINSVSTDGKTLGYTVTNAEKGALLIAASYDSRGTLLSVAVVDLKDAENVTDSVSLAVGGTTYKLMLVNASYVPLCKAAVWPLLG